MSALGPAIHLMESHDQAYHVWRAAGTRDRVLVHVDAHHDMWWAEDERHLSLANFICLALRNGFVREIFWVVPDRSFATAGNRAAVEQHVQKIVEGYPGEPAEIQSGEREIRTTVLGRLLVVCALDALPEIAEPILLDIDTDYLVLPKVTYGKRERPNARPWRWPEDLVSRLKAKAIDREIVTIAYSVDGGFTPIEWKYLGDELAYRLRCHDGPQASADDRMLCAFEAMRAGDFVRAGDDLGAAAHFRLAFLLAAEGRVEEGRRWYERAVASDPSYGAPFATPGIPLFLGRQYDKAEEAFRLAASLDPKNADPFVGMAWIAVRRRRWTEAETCARAALSCDSDSIDAHRVLAEALDKQDRIPEAIAAYERSLKLALHGRRPFSALTVAGPEIDRPVDTDHARTHARLARLHERAGDAARALAGYRIAAAGGYGT